ncbi:MAG: hypothetical protein H7Z10_14190, partial [Gemmatimonadaceae bacterium]|nr:hypothetical protein [Acetobacteraceae bacterium]
MRMIPRAAHTRRRQSTMAGGLAALGGSLVALVTPFRDGDVDTDALAALCE